MFKTAISAPVITPAMPIGMLMDIPTGQFVEGDEGQMVLFGGQNDIDNFAGPGNTFKTEMIIKRALTLLERYPSFRVVIYDTENTLTYQRLQKRAERYAGLKDFDFMEQARLFQEGKDPRFVLVRAADMSGEKFFELMQDEAKLRHKQKAKLERTLPYVGPDGNLVKTHTTIYVAIDTLSTLTASAVEAKFFEKAELGSSDQNMLFMRNGAIKSILILQLPNLSARGGMMIGMTAHMGEVSSLDPRAAMPLKLSYTKTGQKHKNVPENFRSYSNNLFEAQYSGPLYNPSDTGRDKTPRYPLDEADMKNVNNDLMMVVFMSTRNKQGPSGINYPQIVSQRHGVLEHLSMFHYMYDMGKGYGITSDGGKRFHTLDIYPDVKVQRTDVRRKIDTDYALRRALEITSEMLQMAAIYPHPPEVTPAELYQAIIDKGYNWDILLNMTRGYWVFKEDETLNPYYELSTLTLCNMAKATDAYVPTWYKKAEKEWEVMQQKAA